MAESFFTSMKNFMKMIGIHRVSAISSYQKQLDISLWKVKKGFPFGQRKSM